MGRRKKNKYRLITEGLKIEQSLYSDYCQQMDDVDIIKAILVSLRYFNVLESYSEGKRDIKLVPLRVHRKE